jgi:hypothetical protein
MMYLRFTYLLSGSIMESTGATWNERGFLEQVGNPDMRKVGKALQAIAAIGLVVLAVTPIGYLLLEHAIQLGDDAYPTDQAVLRHVRLLALLNAPVLLSVAWMLYRLRQVGTEFARAEPVSLDLALAFWRLRNAIIVCAILAELLGALRPDRGTAAASFTINLDLGTAFLGLVAAALAHAIAKLVLRATRLREDNEAIV